MQYKIIVDKQPSTSPTDEKKEYIIDIEELRVKGDVYDSLNIELNRTYVTRRLSLSEYGVLSVLDEPITQELTEVNIELFEGDNYIYLSDMQGNNFYAEYLIKNDFNDIYATKNEMNSAITQTAQSIELSVNQKLEGYSTTEEMNSAISQTAQEINLEVSKKVGEDEIISSINQSAEEIQINADKISLEGKEINLTSDDIEIKSTNFNVNKNGNIILSDNGNLNNASLLVENNNNINMSSTIWSYGINAKYGNDIEGYFHAFNFAIEKHVGEISSYGIQGNIGDAYGNEDVELRIHGSNDNETILTPDNITTPKLTQTSLENIKKNINKFTKDATAIINNSDIYEYNLKSDKDTDKKMIGFVIGEEYKTPSEVISKEGQAVELYSAIGILWKAVQELSARVEQLEKEARDE